MGKLNDYEIRQRQSLPLEQKIILSQQRIMEWYDFYEGDVYVSFSGGKDSSVLLDIVRGVRPDVPAVFVDTGLEYPENRDHVKTISNLEIIKPNMPFPKVIEKWGYPVVSKEQSQFIYEYRNTNSEKLRDIRLNGNKWGRGKISKKWLYLLDAPFKISDKCCNELKKKPFYKYEKRTGRKGFIGVMAEESSKRVQDYGRFGCNAFDCKRPISRPMGFWTEQDVLRYIKELKLPYSALYGDIVEDKSGVLHTTGVARSGCVYCLFGVHIEQEPNRIQCLKQTHPKLHNYCIGKLGLKEVLEFIDIPYE